MSELSDDRIDTSFDVRSDATTDDPDQSSPTLRRYHQMLWSKPLPDGNLFELDTVTPWAYLHHASARGEFFLSSDSITHSYATWKRTASLIGQMDRQEIESFQALGYTIGEMLIFPSNKIEGATRSTWRAVCTPRSAIVST